MFKDSDIFLPRKDANGQSHIHVLISWNPIKTHAEISFHIHRDCCSYAPPKSLSLLSPSPNQLIFIKSPKWYFSEGQRLFLLNNSPVAEFYAMFRYQIQGAHLSKERTGRGERGTVICYSEFLFAFRTETGGRDDDDTDVNRNVWKQLCSNSNGTDKQFRHFNIFLQHKIPAYDLATNSRRLSPSHLPGGVTRPTQVPGRTPGWATFPFLHKLS